MRLKNRLLTLCVMIGLMAIPLNANAEQKRIKPSRVTIKNHEQFMAQFKRDFPAGTPVQDVMAYLSKNGIGCSYAPPGSLAPHNDFLFEADGYDHRVGHIQCMLEKISNAFFIFRTDLSIEIYISDREKVLEIKHKLIHTAF